MTELGVIIDLQPIDGGYRIAENETHYFDVMKMMFNWRICLTLKDAPILYDQAYCYVGTGNTTFLLAVAAAQLWAVEGGPEPYGWNKNIQTGEYRTSEWWNDREQD